MSDFPTPTAITSTPAAAPYQTPTSTPQYQELNKSVSNIVINHLVRTRGWVRLCSVLGFIGSAFMVLAGLVMLVGGAASSTVSHKPAAAIYGSGMMVGMGVFYLVFSILYIFPSLRLWQYASSITILESSQQTLDLETALDRQRSFWKFVGIMITITLILYIVAIAVFTIGAVAAASALK